MMRVLLRGAAALFVVMLGLSARAVCATAPVSELPLRPEVRFDHITGTGPTLKSCQLFEDGSFQCETYEDFASIACFSESVDGGSRRLKVLRKARVFSCADNSAAAKTAQAQKDPSSPTTNLIDRFRVELTDSIGRLSQWRLFASGVDQQRTMRLLEVRGGNRAFSPWYQPLNYSVDFTDSFRITENGPTSILGLSAVGVYELFDGLMEFAAPSPTEEAGAGFGLGIRIRAHKSATSSWGPVIFLRSRRYSTETKTIRQVDTEVGFSATSDLYLDRFRGVAYVNTGYPWNSTQSLFYGGRAGIQYRVWADEWFVGMDGGYQVRSWKAGGIVWNLTGPELRLSVSYSPAWDRKHEMGSFAF